MNDPRIVECTTGHWSGERSALTISGACPICGSPVTDPTDEPVIVRSDRGDYDPLADTR